MVSVASFSPTGEDQNGWVARVLHIDMRARHGGTSLDKAALEKFRTKWSVARTRAFSEVDAVGSKVASVFQALGLGQDFLVDFNSRIEPLRHRFDDPLAPLLDRLERSNGGGQEKMLPQLAQEIARLRGELASDPTIRLLQSNAVAPVAFAEHFEKPLRTLATTIGA